MIRSTKSNFQHRDSNCLSLTALAKYILLLPVVVIGSYYYGSIYQQKATSNNSDQKSYAPQNVQINPSRPVNISEYNEDAQESGEYQKDDAITSPPQNSQSIDRSSNEEIVLTTFTQIMDYLKSNQYVKKILTDRVFSDGTYSPAEWSNATLMAKLQHLCIEKPQWASAELSGTGIRELEAKIKTELWFEVPIKFSSSRAAQLSLWFQTADCQRLLTPEQIADAFIRGTLNVDKYHILFTSHTYIGADFSSAEASEILMSSIWFYNGKGMSTNSWSPTPFAKDRRLDASAAASWGFLAALRGSDRALDILERQIIPKLSSDQVVYAIELTIDHAKSQVERVATNIAHHKLMRDTKVNSIPVLIDVNFARSRREEIVRLIDININKIQSWSGYNEYLERPEGFVYECTHAVRDVPAPDSLAVPIIKENYEKCLSQALPAIAKARKSVRDIYR